MTTTTQVKIETVNVIPELDPYHRDTQGCSYTELAIDPAYRKVWVTQEYRSGSTPEAEWHNRILTAQLEPVPDGDALREFLSSADGQEYLARICDGHEIEWDGSNNVGKQNVDSNVAMRDLMNRIADLPESEWEFWAADEWLYVGAEQEITSTTTDEQLQTLAQVYENLAKYEHVVLHADAIEYLTEYRDRLRIEEAVGILDALKLIIARSRTAAGDAAQTIRAMQAKSPIAQQRYLRTAEIALYDPSADFTDDERALISSYIGEVGEDTDTRERSLRIRVTEDEKSHIESMAKMENKTVTDYIRSRIGL